MVGLQLHNRLSKMEGIQNLKTILVEIPVLGQVMECRCNKSAHELQSSWMQ